MPPPPPPAPTPPPLNTQVSRQIDAFIVTLPITVIINCIPSQESDPPRVDYQVSGRLNQ